MATYRATPTVVINTPTPALLDGTPVTPAMWAHFAPTITATEGPGHIREQDPKPVWDGHGWVNPPPPTTRPWKARWVVDDLPDPPSGGFYWLGEPSGADGTLGIGADARQWKPHGSTPAAPTWRSFFPFKPSVVAFDSWLPGGDVVHHPKGVNFNAHYVEHMWADFGGPRRQPFTWVIAAMIVAHPWPHYRHYILDAGRNPDAVGFPRLSADAVNTPRRIHDNLDYRTLLAVSDARELGCTRPNLDDGHTIRMRHGAHTRPKMFYGVYNGAHSRIGYRDVDADRHRVGPLDNGTAQTHRYYVIGRSQGWISQAKSSHLLMFELRYWDYTLSEDELDGQFKQLSTTYQFHRYRNV